VLQASDAVRREATLPQGGTVTMVNSAALGRAVLVAEDLKDPPEGKVYELWLQGADDEVRPAGLVENGGDKAVVLTGDSRDAKWAGITVEPVGGSSAPTGDPIAQFSFGEA
jgi:anti-sigma-K factor RskA